MGFTTRVKPISLPRKSIPRLYPHTLCFRLEPITTMNLPLLLLSFSTVFFAELGDKSSLAGIALCGTAKHPRAIYIGLLCALIFSTLVGAVVGNELSDIIPVQAVLGISAFGFAFLGIRMLWPQKHSRQKIENSSEAAYQAEDASIESENKLLKGLQDDSVGMAFGSTFLTIFLAQLGDFDQITTMLLSATSGKLWTVFSGAALAMVATSLVDLLIGRGLARWISQNLLKKAAGVTLVIISSSLFWNLIHGVKEID